MAEGDGGRGRHGFDVWQIVAIVASAGFGGVNPLEILMWRADMAIRVMDGIGAVRGQRPEVRGQGSEWMAPEDGLKAIRGVLNHG